MYSTMGVLKNSKQSGKIAGTHQKLDRAAMRLFVKLAPRGSRFPNVKEVLSFEGNRGPDGLKRKSPGVDEPMHFIQPENDDGKLIKIIMDHQWNLRRALAEKNMVRASYEAAWMAHAITDGLTPAHHYPFLEATEDLISEKEFVKIFGVPIKGIMRGKSMGQALKNNWLYWGAGGFMTKHIAFEYGCALTVTMMSYKAMTPKIGKQIVQCQKGGLCVDLEKEFYRALDKISKLDMYDRFLKSGWTTDLAYETKMVLIPEIVRAIVMGWLSSMPENNYNIRCQKCQNCKKMK